MSFANLFSPPKPKDYNASDDIRQYFTKDLSYYVIPDGVTGLRPYCFYNLWPPGGLKVILPKTLTYISSYAFSECAISEIVIPGNVKNIDDFAFYGAPLTSVVFENGIERIGEGAFKWGPILHSVVIPDSVTYIGKEAFAGMDLPVNDGANVTIGKSIQFIGDAAFNCPVKSMTIHRKAGSITDGSIGREDEKGIWHDAPWYEGYDNPAAIWDGDS